jgi:hypothetical protein
MSVKDTLIRFLDGFFATKSAFDTLEEEHDALQADFDVGHDSAGNHTIDYHHLATPMVSPKRVSAIGTFATVVLRIQAIVATTGANYEGYVHFLLEFYSGGFDDPRDASDATARIPYVQSVSVGSGTAGVNKAITSPNDHSLSTDRSLHSRATLVQTNDAGLLVCDLYVDGNTGGSYWVKVTPVAGTIGEGGVTYLAGPMVIFQVSPS